jgi:uncharacterized membrane protein
VSLSSWALVLVSQLFDVSVGLIVSRYLALLSASSLADVSSVLGVAGFSKKKIDGRVCESLWQSVFVRVGVEGGGAVALYPGVLSLYGFL